MDNIQPGQILGAYRIVNQIGQGGMATVYKAYHAAMDRYVAVKVLPTQFAESAEFMGRFQQEARTIANLEHPRILPVYDYGTHDNIPYFVMRYLDTGTLKDRIKAEPISLAETDRLFTQLADALGYAHERGVIHRDIKPSNALVDSRGGLFLTDFGIAKLAEGVSQFTATGAITGTPAYMSPEQAQGEKIDHRSDIYSLGIVLYEMVTGRVPFEAETPLAVIFKHIQAALPLPSEVNPDVSPEVERVLLKALAKAREDRFNTCGEFLEAWKAALTTVSTAKFQPPPTVVTSAMPAAPTVVAPPPQAPQVKTGTGAIKRKRRFSPRTIVAASVALLCVTLFCCGVIAREAGRRQEAAALATSTALGTSAPTQPSTDEPASPETPPATEAESVGGAEGWTSWTAANTITAIYIHGDEIYTAGPGGVTVWNRADGGILRQYTTADGLPSARVHAIFVEEDDTVWVGTENGLVRFLPEEVTLYTVEDGIDYNLITAITKEGERLLVGTNYSDLDGGGLNVFDGQLWSLYPDFPSSHPDRDPGKLSNFVTVIYPHSDGTLWVGTNNGLGYYDGEWTRFSTDDGLPDNNILAIYFDQDGTLLVGTASGTARFDGQKFETTPQGPSYGVYGITQDGQGRYYFSGGGGIWRFNAQAADWQEFSTQTGDLPVYELTAAARDEDGVLYFGSYGGGLFRYDGEAFTNWTAPNTPSRASFGQILSAPDGSLWFTELYGGGTDRFDPASETWNEVTDLPCGCEPGAFDAAGNLWAREWQNGIWVAHSDGSDPTHIGEDQGFPKEAYAADIAFADDGSVWFATDLGLMRSDGATVTQTFTSAEMPLPDDFTRQVFVADEGSVWAAGSTGMARLAPDGTWEGFDVNNPFKDYVPQVYEFAEDAEGVIWVAAENGVYKLADGQWQAFIAGEGGVGLPNDSILNVTIAPDGTLWFGTGYSGAVRYDGSEWERFTVDPLIGLIADDVYDIFVDGSDAVWFATGGGATRYVP